jgi:hypothetical protein
MLGFPRLLAKATALVVAPALFVCISVQSANAAMVATAEVAQAAADVDRERVRAFLDRDDVRGVLERWDVSAEEAKARVDSLTDAELASIAGRIDAMPAGGSTVGAILGALLLIFVILLITDLLGLTDVFPFVRKR